MRPAFLTILVALLAGSSAFADEGAKKPACDELPWKQWTLSSMLVVHEATTCSYVVTWTGWSPPRKYTFAPDAGEWVSDYFISGAHGRVFWNVKTNAVVVRPLSKSMPLDLESARHLASWAQQTLYPGIKLETFSFYSVPCPEQGSCGPQ